MTFGEPQVPPGGDDGDAVDPGAYSADATDPGGYPAGAGDPGAYYPPPPLASAGGSGSGGNRFTTLAVIGAAAVVLGAAALTIPHFMSSKSKGSSTQQLATASVESFPVTVSANGTVVPASEVGVNFATSGQLSELDAQVGQKVAKGTVLARLSSSIPQNDVAKAQAAVSAAQAQLLAAQDPLAPGRATQLQAAVTSAQAIYAQTVASVAATASEDAAVVSADKQQLAVDQQRLTTDGCSNWQPSNALICQSDQSTVTSDQGRIQVDQARAQSDATDGQLREAQAQGSVTQAEAATQSASTPAPSTVAAAAAAVSAAQAQLQSAQAELAALTLVAPSDGTILQVNGQLGETVNGSPTGAPTLPGTSAPIPAVTNSSGTTLSSGSAPLIVIGSTNSLVVGAAFPASDASELAAGQRGTITAQTMTGLSVPCHILAVASDTTVVDGSPVVYASVIPDGPLTHLSPGLAVAVNIGVSEANNVLAVPQTAVFLVSGLPHVDVWDGKHAVSTSVSTGVQGTSFIQITSGLQQGQQVVLSAYQGLPGSATAAGGT
jgi:HlyD family secretion protein